MHNHYDVDDGDDDIDTEEIDWFIMQWCLVQQHTKRRATELKPKGKERKICCVLSHLTKMMFLILNYSYSRPDSALIDSDSTRATQLHVVCVCW